MIQPRPMMEETVDRRAAAPGGVDGRVEDRLRRFLLVVSGFVFAGGIAELWLAEHAESVVQVVPFFLCGIGLAAVTAAYLAPGRLTLLGLRGAAVLAGLGALYGIYEHLEHNLAFELEIRPSATTADVLVDALYGASPLLAPGILLLAAVLAAAGTYCHPELEQARG